MNKTLLTAIAATLATGMAAQVHAAVITSVADGAWSAGTTWNLNPAVPTAGDTVDIKHAVTMSGGTTSIGKLKGNKNTGILTLTGAAELTQTLGGHWNEIGKMSILNGSVMTFNSGNRARGTLIVTDSTFTTTGVQDFRGTSSVFDNAHSYTNSTISIGTLKFWDDASINSIGSLNNLTIGSNNGIATSTKTFGFEMDNQDAALSTFNYTTLDLNLDGTWNLEIDVTDYNSANNSFVLFDATNTITGTFDNVSIMDGLTDVSADWTVGYTGTQVTLTAVPEPSSYALIAGLLGLTWVMVRRRA